MNILKQQAISLDFVLYGLPPKVTDHQALESLENFGELIGETVVASDLKQVRGVGPKNKNETKVVGSFYLQEKKDKVFRAYKLCSFFLVGRNCHQHYDKIYVEDIVKDIPADSP